MTRETLRQRLAAATPGPWEQGGPGDEDRSESCIVNMNPRWEPFVFPDGEVQWLPNGRAGIIYDEGGHRPTDAALIAHARQDLPALLALADAAAKALDQLERYWQHGEECEAWEESEGESVAVDAAHCDCGVADLYRLLREPLTALEALL